jgi:signal transduction histidine kinase
MMQQSIHKLDETLKEILEYSRNARTELRISQVDIKKTIEESLDRMKFIEGSDTIRKSIRIANNAPFYTDAYRLSVIMNNIVSNAIKYRDSTRSDSWFEIEANVTDGQLHMFFSDNGIGIGQAHLPRIFEMFFRATERSDGAGLGLYIVRETVDKLDGNITIESTAGSGTVISIMLPNLKKLEGASAAGDISAA